MIIRVDNYNNFYSGNYKDIIRKTYGDFKDDYDFLFKKDTDEIKEIIKEFQKAIFNKFDGKFNTIVYGRLDNILFLEEKEINMTIEFRSMLGVFNYKKDVKLEMQLENMFIYDNNGVFDSEIHLFNLTEESLRKLYFYSEPTIQNFTIKTTLQK